VTYGHSKDRRPDLKQIMYGMMMSGDGGVPVFGEALDGNTSDTAATADFFRRLRHLVEDPRKVVCVSDCKGWSGSVVAMIQAHGMRLLSRLPRNHGIYSEILAKPWKPDGKIATGQRRRKDAAPDIYEYMGMDVTATFTIVHPEGEGQPKRSEVVLAPARAIRVFSTGLLRTKVSTLKRIRDRDQRAATVFMRDAQKRAFACEEDAKRAARRDVEAQRRTRSVNLFVGS